MLVVVNIYTVYCTLYSTIMERKKVKHMYYTFFTHNFPLKKSKLIGICTVILFVSVSAIFGTCTAGGLNGNLVVDKNGHIQP
jgi:hypothetical protein